uniref:Uncharacterized protein n=1 Tax=Sparus aurata TaxID=8175 RepID=A0A671YDX9_SPAAU
MWTTLSASRWICLLTLTVVMLVSASQGKTELKLLNIRVKTCYEQKPREGCQRHAFL